MVLLRNSILVLILFVSPLITFSQDKTPLQDAFIESFTLESTARYAEAADVIMQQYVADSYETNLRMGWLYYKAGDFQKSDKYYTIAAAIMPYAVEAKLGATLPKSALELWDDVLQLYKEVLLIDAKNNVALYNAGLIYYNREKYVEAYPHFNELNNLYPTDYSALLMHAWSALKLGKAREAKVLFNSLLLLYPNDDSAKEGLKLLK